VSSLNPMGGRRGPPPGATPVHLDSGELVGFTKLREPKPGGVFFHGIDTYRGPRGVPWKCFPNMGEAEAALRALRQPTGDEDEEFTLP
jgi:hypothetical protein